MMVLLEEGVRCHVARAEDDVVDVAQSGAAVIGKDYCAGNGLRRCQFVRNGCSGMLELGDPADSYCVWREEACWQIQISSARTLIDGCSDRPKLACNVRG